MGCEHPPHIVLSYTPQESVGLFIAFIGLPAHLCRELLHSSSEHPESRELLWLQAIGAPRCVPDDEFPDELSDVLPECLPLSSVYHSC